MLISIFYEKLVNNEKILNKVSQIITRLHIKNDNKAIQSILVIINELDVKETFLEDFIEKNYLPILQEHFKFLATNKIVECSQK